MAIIISKDGKDAKRVEKASVDYESYLQQYIHLNPDILPVHEISEGTKLLVLAREFQTTSGPIDALGIDNEGHIYIIETKLLRNPDRRLIVAQALDYGAALWKGYERPDEFIKALGDKCGDEGLSEKILKSFGISDDEVIGLIEKVKANLQEGSIRFILLMDKLHDHLKDLIVFMNQNSKFDFYGVELDFYKYDDLGLEIMIPNMFGMGIRKDVGSGISVEAPIRIMNRRIMKEARKELIGIFEKDMHLFSEKFHVWQSRSGNSAHLFVGLHYESTDLAIGAELGQTTLKVGFYSWTERGQVAATNLYKENLSKALPGLTKNPEDENNPVHYEVPLAARDNEQEILDLVVGEVTKFTKQALKVLESKSNRTL